MNTLRITTAALAIALGLGISSTSFAFMVSPDRVAQTDVQVDLLDTLESMRDEIAAGETEVADLVEKINVFVKRIDEMLDEGVENEDALLAIRDQALALRQTIPGLEDYLAEQSLLVGDQGFMPIGGMSGGFKLMGKPCGHHHHGGGGGGGAGGGAGGLAVLGIAATAIAVPLGVSNNDGAGRPGSPAIVNP